MNCSDSLLLQRFIDRDLDDEHAEIVAHHLESCAACRAEAQGLAELRRFVQDRLGLEDEGEEEAAAAAFSSISARLPTVRRGTAQWWRPRWLAAAGVALAVLLLPIPVVSTLEAWPRRILERAVAQERSWRCQPNKLLHWQVETISTGVRGVADGRRQTLFWRRNGETTFAEISRQVREDGTTEFAYWNRDDGSSIHYRNAAGVLEITPSNAAVRQALPHVAPDVRGVLESRLAHRMLSRSLDVDNRRDIESLYGRSMRVFGGTTSFDGIGGAFGEVRQIRVVKERPLSNPAILRVVHEYDVDASTLRLLRLKTTVSYADGTTGVHDSRWTVFREASPAEFDAQTPDALIAAGVRVQRLTPVEYARRHLRETSRTATN